MEEDLKLEERLTGRSPTQQATVSCAMILESPNGEFRRIFDFLNKTSPDASSRLAVRIDPETGLMQEQYFIRRISYELQAQKWSHAKRGKPVAGTYALFTPWDTEETKEYLKANKIAPTKLIGILEGGVVGAFLPCDIETAQKALSGCPASSVLVPYMPTTSFPELHESAVRALMPILKRGRDALRINIAEAFSKGADADAMIGRYRALKDAHEKLAPRYS